MNTLLRDPRTPSRKPIELSLVELALEALVERLCAEHPTLQDFAHERELPEFGHARAVLDHVDGLRLAIDVYVSAVGHGVRKREAKDEPF
jgi:hypothetical protein